MRHPAAVVVAALVLLAGTPRATADPVSVTYRPPVNGPITDRFRPSASGYGAGNLGVDYTTAPGTAVWAAAPGQVTFAGPVAGAIHVVVLHADGIRTSYSFLASASVARGQRIGAGEPVGLAGPTMHFGARAGDAYVDPEVLLGAAHVRVRLVPDGRRGVPSEADERSHLARLASWLGRTGRDAAGVAAGAVEGATAVGADAVAWAREVGAVALDLAASELADRLALLRVLAHYGEYARALVVPAFADAVVLTLRSAAEWWHQRTDCTPASEPAPPLAERRVVVEVAGLGSGQLRGQTDSGGGAVFEVDTAAVWGQAEVHRFSYRGGTTAERGYASADTQVDIRTSGRRLRELLERLGRQHPGVPVDIVAHSQGGLVVRSALGDEVDGADPRLPPIASVVTLGTPHHGANLATAGALLSHTTVGLAAETAAGAVGLGGIDPRSTSVGQMAETSSFIRALNRRPLPPGIRFTSIAARGDPVVPSPRSRLDGATNVIVDVPGVGTDHAELPGSDVATREIALAVAGRPPTCTSLLDALGDAVTGHAISVAEDLAALGAGTAAVYADRALPVPTRSVERTDP